MLHMLKFAATGRSPGKLPASWRRECLLSHTPRRFNDCNKCMQVVEKVDLHYTDKRLYHVKNDPMRIIVHYDTSIDR